MKTAIEYAVLVALTFATLAAFRCLCLVSRECRVIRAELDAAGDVIDPVKPMLARLEVLHATLFGSDE